MYEHKNTPDHSRSDSSADQGNVAVRNSEFASASIKKVCLPAPGETWPYGTYYAQVPTMSEARRLLGPDSDTVRRARSQNFLTAMPHGARTQLRLGMHDRGEEYVFADGQMIDDDRAGQAVHFPLHLKVIHLSELTIGRDEIYDVTSSCDHWPGLHFREELYVYVRIERLTVQAGAKLEVHGNVFVLICDEIILEYNESNTKNSSRPSFEIKILGTDHAPFSKSRSSPAQDGTFGSDGADGMDSSANSQITTLFGSRLRRNNTSADGQPGMAGSEGSCATAGQNGGMSMLADIRINKLKNFKSKSLRIFAQACSGHPGGNGGAGGNGGNGGAGADGLDAIDGLVLGGKGGRGAHGGDGGHGGHGGHGGLASNIFVQIPKRYVNCFQLCPRDSVGGQRGVGGRGGKGGEGGAHGALCGSAANQAEQSHVPEGNAGRNGQHGLKGRSRKGPSIYINSAR